MKKKKGFTFVEILVVIFIVSLLSALVVANYRSGEKIMALKRGGTKLAQQIRKAQQMAMSAKELPGGGFPAGGYGIYFEKYTIGGVVNYDIYLYADISAPWERYGPADQIIETIYRESTGVYLEKGVKVKEVRVDGVTADNLSINFKPPDPTTKLRSGAVDYTSSIITLALKTDPNTTTTITVYKSGLIETK